VKSWIWIWIRIKVMRIRNPDRNNVMNLKFNHPVLFVYLTEVTGLKETLLPGDWALQEDQADGGVLLVQVNSQRVFTLQQNTVSVKHLFSP
jgi:hypothetical protein